MISLSEAVSKYRAAIEVRNAIGPDVVLVARSDARGVSGGTLADTIERCKAYRDAGVDLVFPEGLLSKQELAEFACELRCPILYNRSVCVRRQLSKKELQELGVNFVVNSGVAVRSAARAIWDYLHAYALEDELLEQRLAAELSNHPVGNYNTFVGFPELRRLEERFLAKDEMDRRYAGSIGFQP